MVLKKIIIGIDPGKNGGIAFLDEQGNVLNVSPMPETVGDLHNLLCEVNGYEHDNIVCYLEKVGGMPGQGGSAMFSFGRNYGHIEMALIALQIPTVSVTPQKWQQYFSVGGVSITKSSSVEKRQHKNKLKEKAQQMFAKEIKKITLKTCDSLLIAEYGRRHEI